MNLFQQRSRQFVSKCTGNLHHNDARGSYLILSKKMSSATREGLIINFVIVVVTSTFVQNQLLIIKIIIPLFRLFCYSLFILIGRAHAKMLIHTDDRLSRSVRAIKTCLSSNFRSVTYKRFSKDDEVEQKV